MHLLHIFIQSLCQPLNVTNAFVFKYNTQDFLNTIEGVSYSSPKVEPQLDHYIMRVAMLVRLSAPNKLTLLNFVDQQHPFKNIKVFVTYKNNSNSCYEPRLAKLTKVKPRALFLVSCSKERYNKGPYLGKTVFTE